MRWSPEGGTYIFVICAVFGAALVFSVLQGNQLVAYSMPCKALKPTTKFSNSETRPDRAIIFSIRPHYISVHYIFDPGQYSVVLHANIPENVTNVGFQWTTTLKRRPVSLEKNVLVRWSPEGGTYIFVIHAVFGAAFIFSVFQGNRLVAYLVACKGPEADH